MPVVRTMTRLPGGLIRLVTGLAAAAVAVIGLAAGNKGRRRPGGRKNNGKERP